jgi:hypothetical protein
VASVTLPELAAASLITLVSASILVSPVVVPARRPAICGSGLKPLMPMRAIYRSDAPPGPAGRWLIDHLNGSRNSRARKHGSTPKPERRYHELALTRSRGRLSQVLMRRGSSGN